MVSPTSVLTVSPADGSLPRESPALQCHESSPAAWWGRWLAWGPSREDLESPGSSALCVCRAIL